MQEVSNKIENKRFLQRVKIFYYARVSILVVGFAMLMVPTLKDKFNIYGIWPHIIFILMLIYSTINVYITSPRTLKIFTFITLILDNAVLTAIIVKSGGLNSPILPTQLVYLIFFTTLFPKPLFVLPPLLTIPIITRIDLLLGSPQSVVESVFMILWLSVLNLLVIYFIVLLDNRERENALSIYKYQMESKERKVLEEKNSIARNLHDGVGGALSSLIIQSEYIISLAEEEIENEEIIAEIKELKYYAEESMDEVRRSLNVIKNNFELESTIYDYIENFQIRNKVSIEFISDTRSKVQLYTKKQVSLFRVFQEIMTNSLKHSGSTNFKFELTISKFITLKFNDFGKGFDPNKNYPGHYGLKNLRERVELLNGDIDINSEIGKGTQITISIPNSFNKEEESVIVFYKDNS